MRTNSVNLDALIPRQDFEAGGGQAIAQPGNIERISAIDLAPDKMVYGVLRKPDFQRETSIWTPDQVRDLVIAYVEEDLVPAIILWRSPANDLFVIDGGHRLSSLIAWVHNDYGDGRLSRKFFKEEISIPQKTIADKTRKLIEAAVGPYREISEAFSSSDPDPKYVAIAKKLANSALRVQWLTTTDTVKAERSFFKINQQGTPIDSTELRVLKSRKCPDAIAARAIIRGGTGHTYWKDFNQNKKDEIEKLGHDIHECLFTPPLATNVIKTLDVPIAGRLYSSTTLPLLLDMVDISNGGIEKMVTPSKKINDDDLPPHDADGSETIRYLKNTKRVATRISSGESRSLGLHPAVYFYSDNGRHQPSSLLAVVSLVKDLESPNKFMWFTGLRQRFETFLIAQKDYPNQIVRQSRGGPSSVRRLREFFDVVLGYIDAGIEVGDISHELQNHPVFSFLKIASPVEPTSQDFKAAAKSKAFLRQAIDGAVRCEICQCLIHINSMTVDHAEDKKSGGSASYDNAQLAHPYCNSSKDMLLPYLANLQPAKSTNSIE